MLFFKTQRQRNEFNNPNFDQRIRIMILALNGEMEHRYDLSLIVTDIHRTRNEQISYYGYFKPSPHFYWRAGDISVRVMKKIENDNCCFEYIEIKMRKKQLDFIDNWMDKHFKYDMTDKQRYETSIVHEVINVKTGESAGVHIHVQCTPRSKFTKIRK